MQDSDNLLDDRLDRRCLHDREARAGACLGEFTLDKDRMKFKANGKKYEYLVVSETATVAAATPKP